MTAFSFLRFSLIALLLLGIGRALGSFSQAGREGWYDALTRSALTPPGWVFGVVWSVLYLMIAVVAWRLWEARRVLPEARLIAGLFAGQMLLNWIWTPVFFNAHWIMGAFLILIALLAVLGELIRVLWRADRVSALFLMPYAAWGLFAAYLSGFIAVMN